MFTFTEEQLMIRDTLREFAEAEVAPKAAWLDETGSFPHEAVEGLTQMGIMGLNVPEEYGGSGMDDEIVKVLCVEELAKVCASTACVVDVQFLSSDIILRKGTEAQKKKYLSLAAQGKIGGFALTEPGAGSDAGAARTTAVKDGDCYVINGSKCFISNLGQDAGYHFVVIALTDPSKGTKGMTAFLVDRDMPGVSVGKSERKMGLKGSSVSELILSDVRVPEENVLGKLGEGFKIAMQGLDGGRIGIAAQSVGLAEGALAEAVKYANSRVQFGKPIAANQGLQWYFAEMATRVEAARLLTLRAADARQKGEPCSKLAAMAKLYASETACYVCDLALQVHGGYGYMKDFPIERMYRDARILRIYEGTSEVQKMVISREVLSGR
ncbi:MAG: acyl-CoA dehydrogenase family protein [Oscillospiraceae bacterium]|nr:acyl-CoA dehydrogenase family protein [Oscillospiraceae bacterium]